MIRVYLFFIFFLFVSHTGAIAKTNKDKARRGENVYSYLKRNKLSSEESYSKFLELNDTKLGKKRHLREGVAYILPQPSENKNSEKTSLDTQETKNETVAGKVIGEKYRNKLFGSKYEEYTVKSDKLKGACFFLSSGHGGPDCGAIGKVNNIQLHEDEYAYNITLRLARCLLEEGATVHIIIQDPLDGIRDDSYLSNSRRETCMGKTIPINQLKRLKQRSKKINSLNAKSKEKYKRAVFIHLDSRSKKEQLDVFFYYAPNSSAGKKLANTTRDTFQNQYAKFQPNRGFSGTVSERSLYVLTQASPVGIYAELGNIQNDFDQRRFLDSNNRQALANWMTKAFIEDYQNSKKK